MPGRVDCNVTYENDEDILQADIQWNDVTVSQHHRVLNTSVHNIHQCNSLSPVDYTYQCTYKICFIVQVFDTIPAMTKGQVLCCVAC